MQELIILTSYTIYTYSFYVDPGKTERNVDYLFCTCRICSANNYIYRLLTLVIFLLFHEGLMFLKKSSADKHKRPRCFQNHIMNPL